MTLAKGDKAPDFTLPCDGGGSVSLSDYAGRPVIVYFYPKDDTPGCTKQACGFSESIEQFNQSDCAVIGISKDSVAKHDKFKAKYNLSFPLASDEHNDVCEQYGVWTEKSMYGKKYWGIERTTFLLDSNHKIAEIWTKVKVDGHIDEVIAATQQLESQ